MTNPKPITKEEREALFDEDSGLPERFALLGARALPDAKAICDAYEARLQQLEEALWRIEVEDGIYHIDPMTGAQETIKELKRMARAALNGEPETQTGEDK